MKRLFEGIIVIVSPELSFILMFFFAITHIWGILTKSNEKKNPSKCSKQGGGATAFWIVFEKKMQDWYVGASLSSTVWWHLKSQELVWSCPDSKVSKNFSKPESGGDNFLFFNLMPRCNSVKCEYWTLHWLFNEHWLLI